MNQSISLSEWTQKSQLLLTKTKNIFKKIDYEDYSLPEDVFDCDKPISIVFVGQFSAGKSSIIKALTRIEDIKIGEGIQTRETHSYDWNGIEIVDTPGIKTGIRPDHDDIAYEAISRADMIVYVVTQELFDDCLGQNFRKLLLEMDKAGEMVLVVNKMADVGNTEENRQVRLKDLEKVTNPYMPSDLRTVFVDAKSYIKSWSECDPEVAEVFIRRSNYEQLVETLNCFVSDKGISAKLTTALYKLYDSIQTAIPHFQSSTGDDDIDDFEEHLRRERYIISRTSWQIETAVKAISEEAALKIRDKGRSVANEIFDCDDEASAEALLDKSYSEVNEIASKCEANVISKIEELTTDCQTQLDEFYNSDFSSALRIKLDKKKSSGNIIINQILKSDIIARGGNSIINSTTGANAAANGLKAFSGSNAHELVLNIGHYFGHSFKPWEAVKWVKKLNTVGKGLTIFSVVLSVGLQAKEDYDENKRNMEMRKTREKIRAGFNDVANNLTIHYNNAVNNLLNENHRIRINDIDMQIGEIRALRKNKSDAYKLLEETQSECKDLIYDIHRVDFSASVE